MLSGVGLLLAPLRHAGGPRQCSLLGVPGKNGSERQALKAALLTDSCLACDAARPLRVPPRASLLFRKFYCGDRPVALMASDRNSETVEFIEPNPVHRSSLSVSQNHGFANKLGLSPFEFDKDRAGSRFSGWHGGRLVG